MQLNLDVPSPLQYFSSLVQSDAHFPLLETAVSLATLRIELLWREVGEVASEV